MRGNLKDIDLILKRDSVNFSFLERSIFLPLNVPDFSLNIIIFQCFDSLKSPILPSSASSEIPATGSEPSHQVPTSAIQIIRARAASFLIFFYPEILHILQERRRDRRRRGEAEGTRSSYIRRRWR